MRISRLCPGNWQYRRLHTRLSRSKQVYSPLPIHYEPQRCRSGVDAQVADLGAGQEVTRCHDGQFDRTVVSVELC
jgi:hypothetical protein